MNNYSILDDINDYLGELGPLEQMNTLEALADWAYAQIDAIRAEEAFLDYEASLEVEGESDPEYCGHCNDYHTREARDQVINSHAIEIINYPPDFAEQVRQLAYSEFGQYRGDAVL